MAETYDDPELKDAHFKVNVIRERALDIMLHTQEAEVTETPRTATFSYQASKVDPLSRAIFLCDEMLTLSIRPRSKVMTELWKLTKTNFNLSQADLGKLCGVSTVQFYRICSGRSGTHNSTIENLKLGLIRLKETLANKHKDDQPTLDLFENDDLSN